MWKKSQKKSERKVNSGVREKKFSISLYVLQDF